jgi:hypothetical protein
MSKTAIQFEEGDVLLEWSEGSQVVVSDGAWKLVSRHGDECALGALELAILDKLTEIVKPLRCHALDGMVLREDGMYRHVANNEWLRITIHPYNRDLFTSWGWPIPAHMEGK